MQIQLVCPHSCADYNLSAFQILHPPVEVELVGQHPPVVPSGLGGVQAAAELLPDGDGDAEGVGPHQRGDVTGRVQQRRVNALGVLRRAGEDYRPIPLTTDARSSLSKAERDPPPPLSAVIHRHY